MRRALYLVGGIALVVVLVIGLTQAGKDSGQTQELPPFDLKAAQQKLAQAPAPLNGLYAQANQLLPGGKKAFDRRVAELKGHPVVVNKWASWCVPCQAEFPIIESVAAKRGTQVAFLGINGRDVDTAADKFLAKRPLPFPSYTDPKDIIATDRRIAVGYPTTLFLDRDGKQAFIHAGTYRSEAQLDARHRPLPRLMPQVRVDPLTGLKTIIAGARARRPGGGFDVPPETPIDPETDPFLEGHEDQTPPELYAVRPNGGAPDTPGWTVRVVPNLYPALEPDAEEPERTAHPELFTAQAATGSHEVIVNAPEPVSVLADLSTEQVKAAVDVVAGAAARARGRPLPPPDRQRAPRGRRVAAAHARAALRARLRARRRRPRARALRRLRRAHDGRQPARRPRAGGGAPARADRGDRRRGRADGPVRRRVPFHLLLAPRRARARFEDDGPTGAALLHDALRRLRARLGASPPLNLWVRTAPRGAEHFCWWIEILPRLTAPRRARARHRREPLHAGARAGGGRAARTL